MDALDEYRQYVMKMRDGEPGGLPEFSREDGRAAARVLLLFQDPGRSGAETTGVVDRDNPDPSAAVVRETEDILPREMTVSWNAIPWAQQGTVAEELELVRRWELVPKLLDVLPRVCAVVLCGAVAHRLTLDLHEYAASSRQNLLVLQGPHPSTRGLNDRWFGRGARKRWLRRVMKQAHDHARLSCDG